MGLNDRGYMRDQFGGGGRRIQLQARPLTPLVKLILLANLGLLLVDFLLNSGPIVRAFGLYAQPNWQVWRPLTYMFVHGSLMHLIFNMMIVWFFGPDLEMHFGQVKFAILYLVSGLAGGLAWLVLNWGDPRPLVGASGGTFGLLAALALLHPKRVVHLYAVLPVKLWMLVAGLLVLELLRLGLEQVSASDGIAQTAHLGGALAGFVVAWLLGRAPQLKLHPRPVAKDNARRVRPDRSSRTGSRPSREAEDIDAAIDPILDKISRHGEQSLTAREREIMDRARKRMAGK